MANKGMQYANNKNNGGYPKVQQKKQAVNEKAEWHTQKLKNIAESSEPK